jgi:hypothetical protein
MVTRSFKLPESLHKRAKQAAKERGPKYTFSDFTRDALEMALSKPKRKAN